MPSEITFNDYSLDAVTDVNDGAEHLVGAIARAIRGDFEANVHIITGAMQASASVITASGSDYTSSVAAAKALNPSAAFGPEAVVAGRFDAAVQVPVSYAAYEELGTARQAAHPALIPAVETAIANVADIVGEIFDV
ncbi:MAG: hypothetical protein NVSMB2_28750 [Chloroflexota bacterium]